MNASTIQQQKTLPGEEVLVKPEDGKGKLVHDGTRAGVAAAELRTLGLVLPTPTYHDTCKGEEVNWDWKKAAWWSLPGPAEEKAPLEIISAPFTMPE